MKIQVPTSLKDITLEKWNEIQQVNELSTNELLTKIKTIEIVCDLDYKAVATFEISSINQVYNQIVEMFKEEFPIEHFTIDGIKYGFITDMEVMTAGEFIDLESYMATDIYKAMAVMYRPIQREYKGLYSIEEYKGADLNSEVMKQAPASAYLSATLFFLNLWKELLKDLPNYIQKNLTDSELQTLEQNGVGINRLTQLREAID